MFYKHTLFINPLLSYRQYHRTEVICIFLIKQLFIFPIFFFNQKVFSKFYLEIHCKIQCSFFYFLLNYKKMYRKTDKQTTKRQEIACSYGRLMKALHFQKVAQRGNVCAIHKDLSRTCIQSLTCYLPSLMYKKNIDYT